MIAQLKQRVFEVNMALPQHGLMVIKPSGVAYEVMRADDMVVVDLQGNLVEWHSIWLNGIIALPRIPRASRAVSLLLANGGIVHIHSTHVTAWVQAGLDIPALGTTHADYFFCDIPCTRPLTAQEVEHEYESKKWSMSTKKYRGGHCPDAGRSQSAVHTRHDCLPAWAVLLEQKCRRSGAQCGGAGRSGAHGLARLHAEPLSICARSTAHCSTSILIVNMARTPTTGKNNASMVISRLREK
ncbi:MAG: class II aldolase/adducin family protein [Symbiopectobacterium sp.]